MALVFYSKEVGRSQQQQKEYEKRIRKINSVNNDLVEGHIWDVPRGNSVELWDSQMKQTWDKSCQKYKEDNLYVFENYGQLGDNSYIYDKWNKYTHYWSY
ncbi:MAG: hypothetical protein AB7U98_14470 [Candidatus Nitrosocosmicus sp.]